MSPFEPVQQSVLRTPLGRLRAQRGMTQRQMWEATGISRTAERDGGIGALDRVLRSRELNLLDLPFRGDIDKYLDWVKANPPGAASP